MNKKNIIIKFGNFEWTYKSLPVESSNEYKIFRYLKNSMSRSKINLLDVLESEDFLVKKCNVCKNKNIFPENYIYDVISENDSEMLLEVTDIVYSQKLYCGCLKGKYNPNSFKFIQLVYDLNEADAKEYLHSRNKSPFYSRNHKSEEDYKKFQTRNLDSYINRYGKEEGTKKYNKTIELISSKTKGVKNPSKDSSSPKYFKNKYGEKWEYFFNEKIKLTSHSLENYILRYGEVEGKKKYDEYCSIPKCRTLEFWLNKGYSEKDAKSKLKNIQSRGRSYFVDKYGTVEGVKKYKNFVRKITGNFKSYSKESIFFFNEVFKDLKFLNNMTLYWKENEWYIYDKKETKIYFYDLYIKDLNLIVEYDTPFFHPNPFLMSEKKFNEWKSIFSDVTAMDKYMIDKNKENIAIEKGFDFHRVYINNNRETEIKKLKLKIKSKYKELNYEL